MSCVLSLWLGCSCRAGYLFRYWGSRSKKTPRNHDSNNHRGSTFKHKLGSPSSRHINAAQTDEGQAYLCKKRTECDFRRLQPLSHNWTSVTYWLGAEYGGVGQSGPALLLLRVRDRFPLSPLRQMKFPSYLYFKIVQIWYERILMQVTGQTASIWPLTQGNLNRKNNRWKKKLRAIGWL